jgi:phosphate transport system substrate-binding protein
MLPHPLHGISLNIRCPAHGGTVMNVSNQPTKRNMGRFVIIAVIIVAVIVGSLGYTMLNPSSTQSASATSKMATSSVAQMTGATQPAVSVSLLGAGATFPAPLIQKWTVEYNKLNPSVTINYNPIGSGGGIQQITQKTVDFGASDAPLTDSQFSAAPGLVLFPETLGGVAVTYNLKSLGISNSTTLRFTGPVIAGIYMGSITKWNDPAIQAINPGVQLPNSQITAVHRSDGSGTTFAFTNFLSVVSPTWANGVGYSTSVTWPVDKSGTGVGASGNAGVAGTVANTPGAIGYVDVIYAISNHLGVGSVQNPAGNFVVPTLQTILWAAGNATGTPNPTDLRLHIVNAQGPQSYPISTYTYTLVYKDMSLNPGITQDKAKALTKFLWWIIHDGQKYAPDLIYVPLPQNVVAADEQLLMGLNYRGQQLLS